MAKRSVVTEKYKSDAVSCAVMRLFIKEMHTVLFRAGGKCPLKQDN